jgi:hypothetical protein
MAGGNRVKRAAHGDGFVPRNSRTIPCRVVIADPAPIRPRLGIQIGVFDRHPVCHLQNTGFGTELMTDKKPYKVEDRLRIGPSLLSWKMLSFGPRPPA